MGLPLIVGWYGGLTTGHFESLVGNVGWRDFALDERPRSGHARLRLTIDCI